MRLDLTLDRRDLARLRRLEGASRTMAAKALTFTAEKARPAWVAGHGVFHKRRAWIDKGVRIRPASASNLSAQVGSIDKYMGRHVVGVGEDKRGRLFIPKYGQISRAGTHTQERAKMRRREANKRKPFKIEGRGGTMMIVRRKSAKRLPLEVMAFIQEGADVTPKLDALGIVEGVTRREFGPIYERLLLKWAEGGKA